MQSNITTVSAPKRQTWFSVIENTGMSVEKIDTISLAEYRTFVDKYLAWYTLGGKTLGQAFCQHFNIQDDILYYFNEYAEDRIRHLWIRQADKLAMCGL